MTKSQSLSYAESGVDIDAGNRLVEKIKPLAKATSRSGSMSSIGGFGGLFDLKATGYDDPILVSATDGVGTKLKLAFASGKHDTIGIDLVAMCVNDLIVQGAEPLFFLDYFACGTLDEDKTAQVIAGIAEGCKQSGCSLIGGETAEMPGLYAKDDYDLAGFAVGAVERESILPNSDDIGAGDVLIGLKSNGFHSNGFSLVRKVLEKMNINYGDAIPFAIDDSKKYNNIAEYLLCPTKIYVKSCLAAIKQTSGIKALSHITGGGLTENLPRVFADNLAANINLDAWDITPEFQWVRESGNIADVEMLKTFNCGIGMVLICAADSVAEITKTLQGNGEEVVTIGELSNRKDDASQVIYSGNL